jgi:RimJ/RimL family protein N-acetyltransferase
MIKGKGFILRHIKMSDAKGFLRIHRDKLARKGFMTYPKNLKEAKKDLKGKISAMKKKIGETFAIEINGEFVGYVEIERLDKKYYKHQAKIGYCLDKKFRGKGITTKAVKLITDYGFKKYKLKRISGWCRTFNKASARVLEKAGYKLEGILRKNKFKDGKYLDDMIWAMVK